MKRSRRKLISYIMLIAFMFSTILVDAGSASAATLEIVWGKSDQGIQVTHPVVDGVTQTVYTLTKDVEGAIHITLTQGEVAVLDGQGHTVDGPTFQYSNESQRLLQIDGTGTLIIKNITMLYKSSTYGIRRNYYSAAGSDVNLVFAGSEPITIKPKQPYVATTEGGNAIFVEGKTRITVEENADVTLQAGKSPSTAVAPCNGLHSKSGHDYTMLTVARGGKLNLIPEKDSEGKSIGCQYGGDITVSKRQWESNLEHRCSKDAPYSFSIVPVMDGAAHEELKEEYVSTLEAIPKDLLPVYLGKKYKTTGYYKTADCQEQVDESTSLASPQTFYATVERRGSKVTFDTKGGSTVSSAYPAFGAKVTKPADPTKSGYTFAGWYKDTAYTQEYDFNSVVNDDTTLYAKWNYIPVAEPEPTLSPASTTAPTATPPATTSTPKPTGAVKNPAKGATIKGADKTKYVVTSTTKGKATVAYKAPGNPKASTVTIPNTVKIGGITYKVTSIAANAFRGNSKIKKVVIGDNIKTIGDNAFFRMKNLQSIRIGKGLVTMGKHVFCHAKKGCTMDIKSTKLKTVKTAQNHGTDKMIVYAPKSKVKAYTKLFTRKAKGIKVKVR